MSAEYITSCEGCPIPCILNKEEPWKGLIHAPCINPDKQQRIRRMAGHFSERVAFRHSIIVGAMPAPEEPRRQNRRRH